MPEQAEPDPDFPTVAFPNPEEPGAIDLALKLATTIEADVVIANDPDTDRCAVATVIDGGWQMLHGDVVGSLLGEQRWPLRRSRWGPAGRARSAPSGQLDRVVAAARRDRRAARARPRVHAHRLQVDLARAWACLRLRGGARLLRRPRPGAGQGRHLRPR